MWPNVWRFVQAESSDIHELDPLLEEEEARTRSAIGRLVDELAHQGHLFVRHDKGLKCKGCNVYRADRQFNFWSRTPCVPRPFAADVSCFRKKKRHNMNASTDNSVSGKSGFSTVASRVTSTSTRGYAVSGLDPGTPVSLDARFTEDPSLPSCLPNMLRQLVKSGGSFSTSEPVVFSELHDVNDMRSIVASDDRNGPRAPLRSNFDDPDEWEPTETPSDQLSFPTSVLVGQTGEAHRMDPVACRPIIKCRKSGCARACTPSEVVHGYQAGKETVTCKICVTTFPRYDVTQADFDSYLNASLAISRRPSWASWSDLAEGQSAPIGEKIQSRKSARSLTNLRTKNRGKISRTCQRTTECNPWMGRKQPHWQPLWAPARPASRNSLLCPTCLVSMDQGLSLWCA